MPKSSWGVWLNDTLERYERQGLFHPFTVESGWSEQPPKAEESGLIE